MVCKLYGTVPIWNGRSAEARKVSLPRRATAALRILMPHPNSGIIVRYSYLIRCSVYVYDNSITYLRQQLVFLRVT